MLFDPAELAPALPDVIAAIGIAFVFAVITFKARSAGQPSEVSVEETMKAIKFAQEQARRQQEAAASARPPPPAEEGS